jgi:dipeptidyl aminopeptidase/acylaminoacyl peptidase
MKKYLLFATAISLSIAAEAQQGKPLTAQDYEHAESFLSYNTERLVEHGSVRPNWLSNDRFWYLSNAAAGSTFFIVDPARKTKTAAFDQNKLAAALSKATGSNYDGTQLPFQTISYATDGATISFTVKGQRYTYNPKTDLLNKESGQTTANQAPMPVSRRGGLEVISPDGKLSAFIKSYNLWVRDVATKKETQLTTDGIKDFGYATDNAGWKSGEGPILRWSPDSKKIATFQQDQRNVSDMYLVTTNVGKPELKAWKYPLPGDKDIITIQRVIVDVNAGKVIRLKVAADPHRATLSDDIASSGTFDDVDWKADGSELAFLSTSRDHKQEKFRIADAATGTVREVFEEVVPTQYESGQGSINWRYLAKSKEIIWYSERDNWGHLYLYDATTGKQKNQITKGDWVVTKLVKVDEKNRQIYFQAVGREAVNPYFSHLYKIDFDGKNLVSLTPESGNHDPKFSPSGIYFVDSYSTPNVAPVSVFRDLNGKLISNLEKADLSRLLATGWKAPTPVSLKAHDGKTDVYGLVFTPTKMDASKKYPVVDYIYPGPQGGSVGSWSFSASRGDNQALAELGFIVVAIEGTSNPLRSKSFHDMSYGDMSSNTLPDQIDAIRQLAKTYPIDTARVGIWGHSGGGFATAAAMFRYPDFFKVGISESGNHENRNYEDDWAERYDGLAANSNYNVPPSNTMLVVDALIKANKDFDLVVFPNSQHGYGAFSPYMMRKRWDYFVKNLLNAEAPKEYTWKGSTAPRN